MLKFKSLFRAVFALALLFGSAGIAKADYPAIEDLIGTYHFKSDSFTGNSSFPSCTAEFDFAIKAIGGTYYLDNFISTATASTQIDYDQSTGVITYKKVYFTLDNATVGIIPADGGWTGWNVNQGGNALKFQVSTDGNTITVPNFHLEGLTSYTPNGTIAATYNSNVAVNPNAPSVSYPAIEDLLGTYHFKSDSFTGNSSFPSCTAEFDFVIKVIGGTYYIDNFISTASASTQIDYDQNTGVITYKKVYFTLDNATVGIIPADGGWTGWNVNQGGNALKFQVSTDGNTITVPNFHLEGLTSYVPNGTIAATYNSNVAVNPDAGGGDEPDPDGFPTQAQLVAAGNYTFTADVTVEPGMSATVEEICKAAANSTFYFRPNEYGGPLLYGFLGRNSNGSNATSYNDQTGELNITYQGRNLQFGSESPYTWMIIADEDGVVDSSSPALKMQVNSKGQITIPPFTLILDSGTKPIAAHFNNCRVNGYPEEGGGSAGGGGGGDEPTGNYPEVSAILGVHTLNATVDIKSPALYNSYFKDSNKSTFKIEENEANGTLKVSMFGQVDDIEKFFTARYNQAKGTLTLSEPNYMMANDGKTTADDGDNTPANVQFGITAATQTGFNYQDWVWQITEEGEIEIGDFIIWNYKNYDGGNAQVAVYTNVEVDGEDVGGDEPENYPAIGEFDGTYKFVAGSFEYNDLGQLGTANYSGLDAVFKDNFEFEIETVDGVIHVKNLFSPNLFNGANIESTYNQETGVLTLGQNIIYPYNTAATGIYLGILADGAEWVAINNPLYTIQIGKDGSINFQPFDIIAYSRAGKPVVAEYDNITVTKVEGGGDGPGGEEPDYANEAIKGVWYFTLNDHYGGSSSLGERSIAFTASLNGNTVTFAEVDDSAEGGVGYPIVAKFVGENTLLFERTMVRQALYPLYQVPFINSSGTSNLNSIAKQSFTATFNPEDETITFPNGAGVAFGNYDPYSDQLIGGEFLGGEDFISATRTADEIISLSFVPMTQTVTSAATPNADGTWNVTVTNEVEISGFQPSDVATWKVNLTEEIQDIESETEWTETSETTATYSNGTLTFVLKNLTVGYHDFKFTVTAINAEGAPIVQSMQKAVTATAGKFFQVVNLTAAENKNDKAVVVTYEIDPYNVTLSEIYNFTANFRNTDTSEVITVPVTVTEGGNATRKFWNASCQITSLVAGTYEFGMIVNGYNQNGDLIAKSDKEKFIENVVVTVDGATSGIFGIDSENGNVRFFDLQGVEIKNPVKGQIVIKVENGKAVKVVL